jgi:MerR family transcriptional regulator, light-induced transcriptional regulator
MYTIKHASEVTGLSPATMRAWERRYGIGTSHRTEAGYRLYDEEAIQTLVRMAALVAAGWSAREAAEETARRTAAGPSPVAGLVNPTSAQPPSGEPTLSPRARGGVSASGATAREPSWDVNALAEAAAHLDADALSATLDQNFSRATFETVVDEWLMPSLVELGQAWAGGRVSVAGEHLASNAAMRRLAAAYEAAASSMTGPSVVIGLPPGSRHELGLLAFAVAARRAGLTAVYLGADVPTIDWATAVDNLAARAVVLSVMQARDLRPLRTVVTYLRDTHPDVLIAVGGSLQTRAPDGCLLLGERIGQAAATLATQLQPPAR